MACPQSDHDHLVRPGELVEIVFGVVVCESDKLCIGIIRSHLLRWLKVTSCALVSHSTLPSEVESVTLCIGIIYHTSFTGWEC